MATIPKAILDLLTNSKTAKFAESLKHSDLPTGWADDPEIVDLAAKAWQEAGTESPFFKAWFGGSKVVDDAGKPLTVYHGTGVDNIDVFRKSKIGNLGPAIYFTPNQSEAVKYAASRNGGDGGSVYDVFVKSQKPWKISGSNASPEEFWAKIPGETEADAIKNLKKKGYDSVWAGDDEIAIYDPKKIKSVNNRGTFNPADPNIYRTLAPLGVGTAAMTAALLGDGSEAEAGTAQKVMNYMMRHRPDTIEDSAALHDLADWLPGIYDSAKRKGFSANVSGVNDADAFKVFDAVRGNPDALVDVFRAVPKGKRDFNAGDWVSISKDYAHKQGKHTRGDDYDIITTKARAGDISEPGDSIFEQGYWGAPVKGTKTRGILPLGAGTAALAASLLAGGDEAKAAAINAALADPASREKAAAAGLPYDPPPTEPVVSPIDILVAPVGAGAGITNKLLAMALEAPVALGLDASLSALGGLFGGGDRKKPGGW